VTDDEIRTHIESLHGNLSQLYEIVTIQRDETREHGRQIAQLTNLFAQDAEDIRALARIAQAHPDRLDRLEGQ